MFVLNTLKLMITFETFNKLMLEIQSLRPWEFAVDIETIA
jgi:hypothetical protein